MTYFDETGLHTINILQLGVMWHYVNSRRKVYSALVHLGISPYLLQTDRLYYVSSTEAIWASQNNSKPMIWSPVSLWIHIVVMVNFMSLLGVFEFLLPKWWDNGKIETGYVSSESITWQQQWRTRSCKSWRDLRWNLFCLLQHIKNPHNPLLKLLWAHLGGGGGAFRKYLLYPDTETTRCKALYLIGQGEGEEGSQGTRQGADEVESMIWAFLPFLLENKTVGSVPAEMSGAHVN